jgi:hypothetical protein
MNYYTGYFIGFFRFNPLGALANIDRFAKQHPLFDSKLAAEYCGLHWDGGYKLKERRTP